MYSFGMVNTAKNIAELFRRDITRLLQEVESVLSDDELWRTHPGVTNTVGNLVLHLEGNLREYIGRQIGGIPYRRERPLEFSTRGVSKSELARRVKEVQAMVPEVISKLGPEQLQAMQAEKVAGKEVDTEQFLLHLYGHMNYHLGQIDYLRRISTNGPVLDFVGF